MPCQGPMEILLVEDSADDLELSLRALRKHGLACQVRVARDGRSALDLAAGGEARGLGLVLLDSRLPGMDGLEVLGELKSGPSTRGIPVVMMVSSEMEREFHERRGVRTDAYMVKPVSFEKLSRTVRDIGLDCTLCSPRGNSARTEAAATAI